MNPVREYMEIVGVRVEDAENRERWKSMIHWDKAESS